MALHSKPMAINLIGRPNHTYCTHHVTSNWIKCLYTSTWGHTKIENKNECKIINMFDNGHLNSWNFSIDLSKDVCAVSISFDRLEVEDKQQCTYSKSLFDNECVWLWLIYCYYYRCRRFRSTLIIYKNNISGSRTPHTVNNKLMFIE